MSLANLQFSTQAFQKVYKKPHPPKNLFSACIAIQYNSISCLFSKVDQALNPVLLILPGDHMAFPFVVVSLRAFGLHSYEVPPSDNLHALN